MRPALKTYSFCADEEMEANLKAAAAADAGRSVSSLIRRAINDYFARVPPPKPMKRRPPAAQ
jgi:hypothetical protein